jgi:VWFA-related protein
MKFNKSKITLFFILLSNTWCFSQTLTVTVTDKENNLVKNLKKEDFKLSLDKKMQKITSLEKVETPLCVGVLFDVSESMKKDSFNKYLVAAQAFESFINKSAKNNKYFFITFAKDVNLELDTTSDQNKITELLGTFSKERKNTYGTAVFDALNLSYDKLFECSERKVIILVSDGEDVDSKRASKSKIGKLIKSEDVIIYSIDLFNDSDFGGNYSENKVNMARFLSVPLFERGSEDTIASMFDLSQYDFIGRTVRELSALSSKTGGRLFLPHNLKETEKIFEFIADELNNQYVMTFTQTESKKGHQKIHVEVVNQNKKDKYKVRTRKGI